MIAFLDSSVVLRIILEQPAPLAEWNDERPIYFATHDSQLATAARALHFEVLGVTL